MKTFLVVLVPCVLLVGLFFMVRGLSDFVESDTPCEVGACPTRLYEGETGKRFVYAVGTQFTVILDERKDPPRDLTCEPAGIVQRGRTEGSVAPPMYATTFVGSTAGTCTIATNTFVATFVIR